MPAPVEWFVCAHCGERFQKAWTDEAAAAEARQNFGVDDPKAAGLATVCDDCFRMILEFMAFLETGGWGSA